MNDTPAQPENASQRTGKAMKAAVSVVGAAFLTALGVGLFQWTAATLDTAPPLTAVLRSPESDCGLFALPSQSLAVLPEHTSLTEAWVYEQGGATVKSVFDLIVQGQADQTVILNDLRVVDLTERPVPRDWVELNKCPAAGGDVDIREFQLDLGDPSPEVVSVGAEGEAAVEFPFTVSRDEPEVFRVSTWATSVDCLCTWNLALDWTSEGDVGSLPVSHDSGQIRTAVVNDATLPYYELTPDNALYTWSETGEWVLADVQPGQ